MSSVIKALLKGSICLPLIALALSGCATVESGQPIKAGDRVGVQFTCRLPDGEVAASTDPAGEDALRHASRIYEKRSRNDAVVVEARAVNDSASGSLRKSLEVEIIDRLAGAVVGLKSGATTGVDLKAERISGLPQEEQFIKIARKRKHPKDLKLTREEYRGRTGKDATVGQPFNDNPALSGKVVIVIGEEVVIRFVPKAEEVDLDFGKWLIKEKEDHFEIEIKAEKGTLVRTTGMVGRITDVDNEFISLDYGHPFGGETLHCDVTVEHVKLGLKNKTSEEPATSPAGRIGVEESQQMINDALKAVVEKESDGISANKPITAQAGDLVTVDYTAALEDGAIFSTTSKSAAKDPARKRVSWYSQTPVYASEEIMAGKQELLPGLGDAVVGMSAGEKKQVKLGPDKAFGPADPQKLIQFPCSRTIPRVIRMPAEEYVKQFSSFPVLNGEVDLGPYLKARVTEVTERDVALESLAKDGQTSTDSYGTVTVRLAGDQVTTILKPLIGAQFPIKEGMGIISASDGKTFTVDTNHPLAGKTIVLDLGVIKVTRATALQTRPVDWIEGYEKGLAKAKEEGKPAVLVLYADWCGFCKRLFAETMSDPRIERIRDKFVWLKVNSDKETKYKEQYGQNGFPMIVLLKPDGTVLKKIDGYRDANALKTELEGTF
jgi:FKBP-type peptidyl-prolyl cis-trans isomerase 2